MLFSCFDIVALPIVIGMPACVPYVISLTKIPLMGFVRVLKEKYLK